MRKKGREENGESGKLQDNEREKERRERRTSGMNGRCLVIHPRERGKREYNARSKKNKQVREKTQDERIRE